MPCKFPMKLGHLGLIALLLAGCNSSGSDPAPETDSSGEAGSGSDASSDSAVATTVRTYFFAADDGTFGNELWKTDGTADGTERTRDINPTGDSDPESITRLNGAAYFSATGPNASGGTSRELWSFDTANAAPANNNTGVTEVRALGGTTSGGDPDILGVVNDKLIMEARGYSQYPGSGGTFVGRELFVSDGTEAGTVMLSDITSGSGSSDLVGGGAVGGNFYFINNSDWVWKTDGTVAGTSKLQALPAYTSGPAHLTIANNRVFWVATNTRVNNPSGIGRELYSYDPDTGTFDTEDIYSGTYTDGSGTTQANDSAPFDLTAVGSRLYFFAEDDSDTATKGLYYSTDGSASKVANLTNPSKLIPLSTDSSSSKALFLADNSAGERRTFVTDGTASGTEVLLSNGTETPLIEAALGYLGDKLVFSASTTGSGMEPWITDGTASGTEKLRDINPGTADASPEPLVRLEAEPAGAVTRGKLVFRACNTSYGCEPWITDGTPGGTELLKDINPGN